MAEPEIKHFFPTPVLMQDLALTAEQNRRIAETIIERERRAHSIGRSNVKGWHSDDDFFDWDTPEINQLHDLCKEAVIHMTRETATGKLWESPLNLYAWANLLRAGSFNSVHDHAECAWAGVYYVETDVVAPEDGCSGLLEFVDPRAAVTGGFTPGDPFDMESLVTPRNGLLVIFPGWLKHIVYPFAREGDGIRISVAFNAHFKRFAHLEGEPEDAAR